MISNSVQNRTLHSFIGSETGHPGCSCFASEPCNLPFGILPGVAPHFIERFIAANFSAHELKRLLVPDRFKRLCLWRHSLREETTHLIQQTGFEDPAGAFVQTAIQLRARRV